MTVEYTGRGDPGRSIELLWGTRERPSRGPKPGLSVDRIVRTAIEVADADGLAGLSMRSVAERLGFTTMSLYRYVPGKGELIDLMVDTVFAEFSASLTADAAAENQPAADGGASGDRPAAGGWRTRLERRALADRALYHRHPWMLQVSSSRAVLGPNELDSFESLLAVVDGIGLSDAEMVSVVELVSVYVRGAARTEVEAAQAERLTGQTNEQWWSDRRPLFEEVFEAERYPVSSRVGSAWYDTGAVDEQFEFGLQRVLDGIEVWIEARSAPATRPATRSATRSGSSRRRPRTSG